MLKIVNQCHYHKKLARELIESIKKLADDEDILLRVEDSNITLCRTMNQQQSCFTHSFTEKKLQKRAVQKKQLLLKACNNKKGEIHSVVDLTAGWGKDSFILATHGHKVTLCEQNPFIYQCLNYLLNIARQDQPDSVYQRLTLTHTNSVDYLVAKDPGFADCLYLDPMFPPHKSSALPGKDLQFLQQLTENRDIQELVDVALQKAAFRVVVKRPLHASTLSDTRPDIVYKEKTIRFDVYLTHNR